MLVNDWMSSPVITVGVDESMQRAVELMTESRVGMLPVMANGKLVGVVTDRDLKKAAPSSVVLIDVKQVLYHLTHVKIGAIMTNNPVTVFPDQTVEEVAQLLLDRNISGCPVVDHGGNLAGIITKNDIFRALVSVSGLRKKGVQFGLLLEDRPGSIKEVTDIIRRHQCRLVSIMTTYDKAPEGFRFAYIRAFDVDRDRLSEIKAELAETAKLLYVADLKEGIRETYGDPY